MTKYIGIEGKDLAGVALLAVVAFAGARQHAEAPVTYGDVPDIELTEVLRIGDEAEGDSLWFEQVGELAVDSKGRIYASGWSSFRDGYGIRVINGDGTFLREIGSRGQAPGEFQGNPVVHVGSQDTVYVLDIEINRLTVFAPDDHEFISTTRLIRNGPITEKLTRLTTVTYDNLLVEYEYSPFRAVEEGRQAFWQLTLFDRSGQVLQDSVAAGPLWEAVEVVNPLGRRVHFPRLFGRETIYVLSPDNMIYYGWNEQIRLKAVTLQGESAHEVDVPYTAVRVTSAEVDMAVRPFPDIAATLRQDVHDTKTAFSAMVADDEGRLWVKLSWPEGAIETTWLIVNAKSGEVVAMASLPTDAEILVIRDGKAYGYEPVPRGAAAIVLVWDITQ